MTIPVPIRHAINEALLDPRSFRKASGDVQAVFWGQFGVNQSASSRYETGTEIPRAVKILIALKIAGRITETDLEDAEQFYK